MSKNSPWWQTLLRQAPVWAISLWNLSQLVCSSFLNFLKRKASRLSVSFPNLTHWERQCWSVGKFLNLRHQEHTTYLTWILYLYRKHLYKSVNACVSKGCTHKLCLRIILSVTKIHSNLDYNLATGKSYTAKYLVVSKEKYCHLVCSDNLNSPSSSKI